MQEVPFVLFDQGGARLNDLISKSSLVKYPHGRIFSFLPFPLGQHEEVAIIYQERTRMRLTDLVEEIGGTFSTEGSN